jgi:4-diphosphocytidyl-2-C-methyl-D-erythritol kinase
VNRPRIVGGGSWSGSGSDAPGGGGGSGAGGRGPRDGDHSGTSAGVGGRLHVVRVAPAKLNLTLAVLGRRDDGYHSLHSVMVPLTLGDALTVSVAPAGATEDSLRIAGIALSAAPDNLILRAIAATRTAVRAGSGSAVETPPLAARLLKRIPVAAGLGGGSSDAAAAIDAALAVWNAGLTADQAAAVAVSLGSDVPFFMARGAALVTGRGEFVEPLEEMLGEPPAVLLVTPPLPLSTAAVFSAFAAGADPRTALERSLPGAASELTAYTVSESLSASMRSGLSAAALVGLAEKLAAANDLLLPAQSIAVGLRPFAASLARLLGRPVGQSGSGPTLWVLYQSLPEARKAARLVRLGLLEGRLPALGEDQAFVAATSIAVRPADQPNADNGPDLGADHRPSDGSDSRPKRPSTVHNGFSRGAIRRSEAPAEPLTPNGDDPR